MYFARHYHLWERGLSEHTNGLVRQYLRKYERLDKVTQWKACLGPIVDKWQLWNSKWINFGIPPDPAWD